MLLIYLKCSISLINWIATKLLTTAPQPSSFPFNLCTDVLSKLSILPARQLHWPSDTRMFLTLELVSQQKLNVPGLITLTNFISFIPFPEMILFAYLLVCLLHTLIEAQYWPFFLVLIPSLQKWIIISKQELFLGPWGRTQTPPPMDSISPNALLSENVSENLSALFL